MSQCQTVNYPTVCLNMIVKNEAKIIERCLESTIGFIDTYCICDTGSTDNTVEVIKGFFKNQNIDGNIIHEPFVSFGHNRTFALKSAIPMADFVLFIDADMVLCNKTDNKCWLNNYDCFNVWQSMGGSRYQNVRIVRSSLENLHYKGATHEYVNLPNNARKSTIDYELFHIDDLGDGGCKDDKFERDIRLLKTELQTNPTDVRSLFYLANSLFDIGRDEEAIKYYLKRLELSGWYQEDSYALMRLGQLYYRNNQKDRAICKWMESFAKCQQRLESLYYIVNHYRKLGNNHMAYLVYKIGENVNCFGNDEPPLFMDESIHKYRFAEEGLIVKFYNDMFDVKKEIIQVLNWINEENSAQSLSNFKFYNPILDCVKIVDLSKEHVHSDGSKMVSSTPSIIQHPTLSGHYLVNQRFVNYTIKPDGSYICKSQILTINHSIILDYSFNEVKRVIIPQKEDKRTYAGIEDIRIFKNFDNKVVFSGTTYHQSDKLGVSIGDYNFEGEELVFKEIIPQHQFYVEKNWVFTPFDNKTSMIYKWHPLQIGVVDKNNTLNIHFTRDTPGIFRFCRGSTNGYVSGNEIWFIVHIVSYESPRHYYHMFVVFDMKYESCRYSAPFKFSESPIEYCLGLVIQDNEVVVTYSTWDRQSFLGIFDKSLIETELIDE